ncbi:PadR family transcriptional regulator [Nocardia higoensis]|uniref:PadR family transcriptional regulator n=1 Tax=Nocardia higoensis TaxID=228599 RepID=A0ABS0D8L9_9NOCA|nr:PadR family transcriptional regulator [Nocardia higoensis]MBF6353987.1 PadR family transcriptional regulator [Nocardia higoensis]
MSVVRLLVLGVLRSQGPAHGYAVRRELLSWRAETWTNAKPGSIYHALKQLSAEGRLREAGSERSDEGPARTLYELTPDGEAEFRRLMDQALVSIDMEELGAGIAFMDALPRAHVIDRLREQQRNAAAVRAELLAMIPEFPGRYETPHATDLLELWSGVFDNLAGWTGGLLARLEAGEYALGD